jgi:hypothetical protein
MNTMVYNPAATEPDNHCMTAERMALEDLYSTTPLMIMRSIYQQPDEEELHSSFEAAISDRVLALNNQHRYTSVPIIDSVSSLASKQAEVTLQSKPTHYTLQRLGTREIIILIAIALMLVLIGFDLMGLLVLFK